MTKIYQHISCKERAVIMANDRQGIKLAEIARFLGRNHLSIGTVFESKAGFVFLSKMDSKSFESQQKLLPQYG